MAVVVRMGFIFFLFCILGVVSGKEFVPAYIWSSTKHENVPQPALKEFSTQEFVDHFHKRVGETKPMVLLFLEENLSVEDFKDSQFPKLKSLGKSFEFISRVKSPQLAIKKVVPVVSTLEDIPEKGSALVVIKLDDAKSDEDRSQLLRRHDSTINKVYAEALKKRKDIVAVYTSHYTSWTEPEVHRVRRLLEDATPANSSEMTLKSDNILIHANEIPELILYNNTVQLQYIGETQDIRANFQSLSAKFKTGNSSNKITTIIFYFYNSTSTTGYWSLENVTIQEASKSDVVLKPQLNIIAPIGFSYHCTGKTVLSNENGSLTFVNFQAQPYMEVKGTFGDAYNCELFFTAPIWSGLFVMTILAMIMIWGLVMIMDIRTMDQFDDPKGKTITISAVE